MSLSREEEQELYDCLTRAFELLRKVRPMELHEVLGAGLTPEPKKYLRQALQKITREIPMDYRIKVIYQAMTTQAYEDYVQWFESKYAPAIKERFNTDKVSVMSRSSFNMIKKLNKHLNEQPLIKQYISSSHP